MIPLSLKLSGFLSYRKPVVIDFSTFELACISGQNGAGKSSLLDAITWGLFGQARKRDQALINSHPDVQAAEVIFTFIYEESIYRVIRTLPREKTSQLEFQILDAQVKEDATQQDPSVASSMDGVWRSLTERTLRETQARIEQVLRLDYETFVNAAFFLQGKVDQFAQQTSGKRKEILGSLLGLESWEIYKNRAVERRKSKERELSLAEGYIREIDTELAEEEMRKKHLVQLESELENLSAARKVQEAALGNVKQMVTSLNEQRKLVENLASQLERSQRTLTEHEKRLSEKVEERDSLADKLSRTDELLAAYRSWQTNRAKLEELNETAEKFHTFENQRQPFLTEIETNRARLDQELENLEKLEKEVSGQSSTIKTLTTQIKKTQQELHETEAKLSALAKLKDQIQAAQENKVSIQAEKNRLKDEMDELKQRIEKLESTDGAICPLCGQPLEQDDRNKLISRLKIEGKEMGDTWRINREALDEIEKSLIAFEKQLSDFTEVETEKMDQTALITQLTERRETHQRIVSDWESSGLKRMAEIKTTLDKETYAAEARKQLAKIDKELIGLGYDPTAHDRIRRIELDGRSTEKEYLTLESARAALTPLEDEIKNLQSLAKNQKAAINSQQKEHDAANKTLKLTEAKVPDLATAERELYDLQERENKLNQEVGAARQKVTVLDDLRSRKAALTGQIEGYRYSIGHFKQLERAFGKDGVPALLIEQALPDIEAHANELLNRLSNGSMSVRFVTQAEYKDKKRDDLKETLEIKISDGAGMRDYETFSGGEAFRVNFAIRLALSRLLAQRKGARLRTLVIDEGFGSQDAQGRQRLIEAINAVKGDFAKILVITHLDELKDAFPTRIDVEKGETGSMVTIN